MHQYYVFACPLIALQPTFYDLMFNPWSSRVSQETKWSQLDALYIGIVVMLWASVFMKIQHSSTKSCSATLSGPSNACLALKDGRETSLGPLTVQKRIHLGSKRWSLQGQVGGRNRKNSDATVCKVLRNFCEGPARQYQCQGFNWIIAVQSRAMLQKAASYRMWCGIKPCNLTEFVRSCNSMDLERFT